MNSVKYAIGQQVTQCILPWPKDKSTGYVVAIDTTGVPLIGVVFPDCETIFWFMAHELEIA